MLLSRLVCWVEHHTILIHIGQIHSYRHFRFFHVIFFFTLIQLHNERGESKLVQLKLIKNVFTILLDVLTQVRARRASAACRLQSIQIKLFNKLTKETTLEPAGAARAASPDNILNLRLYAIYLSVETLFSILTYLQLSLTTNPSRHSLTCPQLYYSLYRRNRAFSYI